MGLPGVVDGGCLLLVIGGSGVDQGGVGGPGTPPSGRAWSEDHFYVYYDHIRGFLGLRIVPLDLSPSVALALLGI